LSNGLTIKLKELHMENFGPYKNNLIKFTTDDVKNVTLIVGKQGSGKTMLFQCLYWLLFPKFTRKEILEEMEFLRNEKIIETPRKSIEMNLTKSSIIEMGGRLHLELTNHSSYTKNFIITRKAKFSVDDIDTDVNDFNVSYKYIDHEIIIDDDGRPYSNGTKHFFINVIDKFIPDSVRPFCLVYGEGISNILSMKNTKIVKKYALAISDHPKIENFQELLKKYSKRLEKKRTEETKNNSSLEEINQEIEIIRDEIEIEKNKETELNHQLEELIENKDNLVIKQDKLSKNHETIEGLQKVKGQIDQLKRNIDAKKDERSIKLLHYGPFLYLESIIKENLIDIEDKRKLGIIPGLLSKEDFKAILERKDTCVCGCEWNNLMKRNIEGLMEKSHSTLKSENTITFEGELKNQLNQLKDYKVELILLQQEIIKNQKELRDKTEYKNTLKAEIPNIDDDLNWLEEYKELEDLISKLDTQIGRTENELDQSSKEVQTKEKNLSYKLSSRKLIETRSGSKYMWSHISDVVTIIISFVENMKDTLVEQIRQKTSEETTKILKKLVSDPENWSDVVISDYGDGWIISVTNNKTVISNISRGQTNILGLSFILALTETLGVKLPLIFDSPFINIDEFSRKPILENLPKLYEGRQLIFMTKETEFSGSKRKSGDPENLYPILRPKIVRI
jgi:DNA sulfur modification protein DndD